MSPEPVSATPIPPERVNATRSTCPPERLNLLCTPVGELAEVESIPIRWRRVSCDEIEVI